MKVLVVGNAHLYKTPEGKYYTPTIYNNEFFQRYLNVFEEVRFVAKTKYVKELDEDKYIALDDQRIEIYELPWYKGMKEMVLNIGELIKRYRRVADDCDCCIFRIAQIESYFSYIFSKNFRKPIAVEVVNDPETFTSVKHIFKWFNIKMFNRLIKKANGVSYVTKNYLQERYPSTSRIKRESVHYFESYYSSIDLKSEYIGQAKEYPSSNETFEIIHVANSINGNTKGHKTLIEAVKYIVEDGYEVKVCFIGDGSAVKNFEQYAKDLKVAKYIDFIGRLNSKEAILNRLTTSDLFVLPTYMEGLPRSIIEAQAVGLPCLSTPIAGVPELLNQKYLFPPQSSSDFAREIIRLINNPEELNQMSATNIEVAREYTQENLTKRRTEFYSKLRDLVVID